MLQSANCEESTIPKSDEQTIQYTHTSICTVDRISDWGGRNVQQNITQQRLKNF